MPVISGGTSLFLGSGIPSARWTGGGTQRRGWVDQPSIKESSPHPGDKLGPAVRDNVLRNPTQMEHLLEHTLRRFHGVEEQDIFLKNGLL